MTWIMWDSLSFLSPSAAAAAAASAKAAAVMSSSLSRSDALSLPPCANGYFQCATGDYCVKQKYNCDDFEDCPDGSDEKNCSKFAKFVAKFLIFLFFDPGY